MITAQDILEFADQNGITLVPGRDAEEWAKFLNTRNSVCPCIETRTCPCQESLQDIQSQGRCECWFYCTEAFADEISGKKTKKSAKATKQTKQPTEKPYTVVNPKVKSTLELIDSIKKYYEKGDLASAYDKLTNAAENDDCNNCRGLFKAEATRVMLVSDVCQSIDGDRCKTEVKSAIIRMNELEKFFVEVDKYGKTNSKEIAAASGSKVPYRTCMSQTLVNPSIIMLAEQTLKPRETKFFISAQLCSNAVQTIEEGLDLCKKTHPDWFQ